MLDMLCWAEGGTVFLPGAPLLEKILRPVVVYAFLVLLLRIFGKRELAQLNPFDLVVLLSLSNTVQNAIIGDDTSLTGGLVGATSLCAINYVVVRFLFKHRRLDQLIEGSPATLIRDGQVDRSALARELMTETDLATIARRQGFTSFDEIDTCILEPGGGVSLKRKKPHRRDEEHHELLERIDKLTAQVEALCRHDSSPAGGRVKA